jgi:hypothetical protein
MQKILIIPLIHVKACSARANYAGSEWNQL